jgi:(2S)-methylsuccinyl-CoA dehydrogenase
MDAVSVLRALSAVACAYSKLQVVVEDDTEVFDNDPRLPLGRAQEPEFSCNFAFVQCTRSVTLPAIFIHELSMPATAPRSAGKSDLIELAQEASASLDALLAEATAKVRAQVTVEGRVVGRLFDREQRATHGLAWLATYVEAVRQLASYAARLTGEGTLGELEELLIRIGLGEYLAQVAGGIPMSQNEVVRLSDLGLSQAQIAVRLGPIAETLIAGGNNAERRARLIELIRASHGITVGVCGLEETLESIRVEMRRFADAEVIGHAQGWHRTNSYIPLDIIKQMSELGVFGLTIPEDFGGMGLGKESMCVVSEELSRGYIGVGSLGTRSEIAAELILGSGTAEQKEKWLPKIASGEVLPTAVFTEPNTGSDLASIKTRAVREGNVYKVYGNKTWITHPVRADLMTLLVRTNPKEAGHRGLSMLLAEKPRGDDKNPFPAKGMSGTEIEVLGYRGMKEYEIAFDGFKVKAENLLGGVEGLGFKQLMQTFESARIQTAARAIGVAQAAMEQALDYAQNRVQFGGPIVGFPRVADKIVMMAAEIMIARQLTYHAAREKDSGRRCDLEAGMAKLLAARVAWAAADNAVQVHGGNGFALEFPVSRILCDARILNIFEGAAEIQAQVIARRLLDGTN